VLRNSIGLIAGPIILIILGFVFFGEWGAAIGFFVLIAAVIFVPLLGAGSAMLGPSLPVVPLVANAIPLGFYLLSCTGRACPNYGLAAAAPQYAATTFCGFIYWLIASRRR
jgi:hypothetical protein